MAACKKCGKQVGCGCNLVSGMCKECASAPVAPTPPPLPPKQ